jgi:phage gp46-like protein
MSDVLLFESLDGGEIESINGAFTMDDGLSTAAYISLFGGNEQDSGSDGDKPKQFWANVVEPDESKHYRSETQYLLNTLPLVPANLKRFQDAATRDLAWMVTAGLVQSASATATMPALNKVRITTLAQVNGQLFSKPFDWVKK